MAIAAHPEDDGERAEIIRSRLASEQWPERQLRIAAVDADTGELVAFDRGSGCTGAGTLTCFLDYLPGRATTVLRFSINVGGAGDKTISAALTLNVWDPDTANNSGVLTLRVGRAAVAGGLTPAATTPTGRTLTGRAGADLSHGAQLVAERFVGVLEAGSRRAQAILEVGHDSER